jgi:hypothetical protein
MALMTDLPNREEFSEVMDLSSGIAPLAALTMTECENLWRALMQVPPGGLVVETGCQLGRSSSLITQARKIRQFHSIHIDPYTQQPDYAKGWVEMMMRIGGEWEHAFTLLCMRTEQAEWHLNRLCYHYDVYGNGKGNIDLAFIDGDHMAEGVKIDMRLVAALIKRGGYLTAHDYGHVDFPGVKEEIDAFVCTPQWHHVGIFDSLGVWRRI